MIKSDSIDQLKDLLRIETVVGRYVTLKKRGIVYTGLCPFHDEKSPSFTVSPAKGIYKCFGCGTAGDSIKFVMEHEKLDFIEAIKKLAKDENFTLEETEETIEQEALRKRKWSLAAVNAAAAKHWHLQLMQGDESHKAKQYLQGRMIDEDAIIQWNLGWAPDEWRFLTPRIIAANCWSEAQELGLVKNKNEQNFDVWRNRIMFPVHDVNGHIVAFGGRSLMTKEEMKETNTSKYNNSKNLEGFFSKSNTLYGLYYATHGIRAHGFALLVEGYTDVIMCHRAGANNTVATLGTALTDRHAALLRKYTDCVVIARDGDAAGHNAMLKDIDTLLDHGFRVDVFTVPDGEDPDTWARTFLPQETAVTN